MSTELNIDVNVLNIDVPTVTEPYITQIISLLANQFKDNTIIKVVKTIFGVT